MFKCFDTKNKFITWIYEGANLRGIPHGFGTMTFINGPYKNNVYTGEFHMGEIDGYGKFTYANGTTFVGQFINGKINGKGVYDTTIINNIICIGEWRDGIKNGSFIEYNKKNNITTYQLWHHNTILENIPCEYININEYTDMINKKIYDAKFMSENPELFKEKYIREIEPKNFCNITTCIICNNNVDVVNDVCGHVCLCWKCYSNIDNCPICRCKKNNLIKLYIS